MDRLKDTRQILRRTGFTLGILLVFMLLLELIGRISVWYWEIPTELRPRRFQGFGQTHPLLWWELQPNLDIQAQGVHVRTNRFGLRDDRDEVAPEAIRFFCLGDSTTYGWRVQSHEMYPAVLERLLKRDRGRPVAVISAGVPGYTSYQTMVQFREKIAPLRPQWIAVLSSNNECRSRSMGDRERGQRIARQMALHRALGFSHFFVLLARGPESLRRSWEMDPEPGRVANGPDEYRQNMLELVRLARREGCEVVMMNVPLRLHFQPTWLIYDHRDEKVGSLLKSVGAARSAREPLDRQVALWEEAVRIQPAQFTAHWSLAQLYQKLGRTEQAELEFRLARDGDLHPEAAKPSYNAVLEALCRAERVPFVDLAGRFAQSGLRDDELFFDHCHPTPAGHQIIAQVLAEKVEMLMRDGEKNGGPPESR